MKTKKTVLLISASDPSGGAGMQSDIKVAVKTGVYPCSVITAITAQNSVKFSNIWPLETDIIESQLDSVLSDMMPDAVKIGMLDSVESVKKISEILSKYNFGNIVLDPVLSPTLGRDGKINGSLVKAICDYLLPLVYLATPNEKEAELIEKVSGKSLSELCDSYLITGGEGEGKQCVDRLYFHQDDINGLSLPSSAFPTIHSNHSSLYSYDNILPSPVSESDSVRLKEFLHKKIKTTNTHGSGCVLSTAIACYLALEYDLVSAVSHGVKFIDSALAESASYNLTKGNYGPSLI